MKFFYVIINGQQQGPFSLDELKEKGVQKDTLVWSEEMNNWQNAGDVIELKSLFGVTPPPVPEKSNIPPTMPPLPEISSNTGKEPILPVSEFNPSNKEEQLPVKKKKYTILKGSVLIGIICVVIKLGLIGLKQINKKDLYLSPTENVFASTPAKVKKTVQINKAMLEKAIKPYIAGETKKIKKESGTEDIDSPLAGGCSSLEEYIIGDLNKDGIDDGIVRYECGGMGQVAKYGFAIFVVKNEKLELVNMDYYPMIPTKIVNGIIYCKRYEYAEGDFHNSPSIIINEQYRLVNNKLVQTK